MNCIRKAMAAVLALAAGACATVVEPEEGEVTAQGANTLAIVEGVEPATAGQITATRDRYDPVYKDPLRIDRDFPPAIAELAIDSAGERLNGIAYLADGPGPHPTMFLLHGWPGNEKSLDIAQALRRAGFNAVFFHYRGTWGSGGAFTFQNVIEDVAAAKAHLIAEAGPLRVDPDRITLLGHSMGGWAALQAAARDETIGCVGALASADFGASAEAMAANPEALAGFIAYGDYLAAGPLSGTSGAAMVAEVQENVDAFSVAPLAPRLAGKSVLLIAANTDEAVDADTVHEPMAAAFATEPGITLTATRIDGDHSFSWTRETLIREVLDWAEGCR